MLHERLLQLKNQKNATIIAHYYQRPEIQDVADFIGDSLQMAQFAASCDSDIIVVAGVLFMAETTKILNPTRKVLLPDMNAGCSLAESCTETDLLAFKKKNPDHIIVSYVNCSAAIKTLSDYVCTSSNAEKVIRSLPTDQPILFLPDRNLGHYLTQKTKRELTLWDGSCLVHETFSIDKLLELNSKYPKAKFIAHPESEPHILKIASYIGSTKGMLDFVLADACNTFIVATETGILHQMQQLAPHKTFIPAPVQDENSCSCAECPYMKLNTIEKLYDCLLNENPSIELPENTMQLALVPLKRMLENYN